MARGIYVSASTPASGKSLVTLGLADLCTVTPTGSGSSAPSPTATTWTPTPLQR